MMKVLLNIWIRFLHVLTEIVDWIRLVPSPKKKEALKNGASFVVVIVVGWWLLVGGLELLSWIPNMIGGTSAVTRNFIWTLMIIAIIVLSVVWKIRKLIAKHTTDRAAENEAIRQKWGRMRRNYDEWLRDQDIKQKRKDGVYKQPPHPPRRRR